MAIYRSAQGKKVDMAALMSRNEKVRAVGVQASGDGRKTTNLKVNARGDTIDAKGNVVKSMNQKRAEGYAAQVGNRGAQAAKYPVYKPELEFTDHEKALNAIQEDDAEVEAIKAKNKGA
jgi:hypothetical protein